MSKRLYPHSRVRYWYAYDVEDVCEVFAGTGLHPQTVRKWIKNGLKTIDHRKPALVYGQHLIDFLKKKNTENKCETDFDQFFCMTCKDAQHIYRNKIAVTQKPKVLVAQGQCRICKGKMFKNYSMKSFPGLRKVFKLVDVSELYDCSVPSDKTHICDQAESPENESGQWSLL